MLANHLTRNIADSLLGLGTTQGWVTQKSGTVVYSAAIKLDFLTPTKWNALPVGAVSDSAPRSVATALG